MSHQATLTYTEPLLRRAVFAFWRRTVGIDLLIATAIVAGALAFFLLQGDSSWRVGVLATVLMLAITFAPAIYVVHYRNTMAKLRNMGNPQAILRAEESSFSVTSGIVSSTLQWSSIMEVWCFPEFWLLLFSKAQFMTVPLSTLSPDMQTFVLQQVKAAGGKVIG